MILARNHRCMVVGLLFTVSGLACAAQEISHDNEAFYLTIQVPGAQGTYPMAVNDSLAVAGYYLVSPTEARGFLQDINGQTTTFSVPGSMWTEAKSMNARGEITGFYELASGSLQGFLRRADGEIITFDAPAGFDAPGQALPLSINDDGEIAGSFPFPLDAPNGFIRSRAGLVSTFDLSGQGAEYGTAFSGLNASGTVVGFNVTGESNGSFSLDRSGNETEFDFPAEAPTGYIVGRVVTNAQSINASGTIAGVYRTDLYCDSSCIGVPYYSVMGAFIRSPEGSFTAFNPPGPIVTSPLADVHGYGDPSAPNRLPINRRGTVTGSYTDSNQTVHAFVRNPSGRIISFDLPGGTQTTATSINNFNVIAGSFYRGWSSPVAVGFIRIPIGAH